MIFDLAVSCFIRVRINHQNKSCKIRKYYKNKENLNGRPVFYKGKYFYFVVL
jgi:hypothetical protein